MTRHGGLFGILLLWAAARVGAPTPAHAQMRYLLGKVSDSVTTRPLEAGQVVVLGTGIRGPINTDGTFVLRVPFREVAIEVQVPFYKRKAIIVPADRDAVLIPLEQDYFQLEQIVISGQATGIERRNLANAIASLESSQFNQVPAATVEQMLTGKVAGANIAQNSGAPGGGMQVRLRGVTTILGSASPLYIVDGVIVSDAAIPGGVNSVTKASPNGIASDQENPVNRIADINPNDIDNIQVLKGASASVIYGSKASNGVIIITTKRGHYVGGVSSR